MALKRISPLKIKVFVWLCLKNRILIWDVLHTRGFAGLGRCILCKIKAENGKKISRGFDE